MKNVQSVRCAIYTRKSTDQGLDQDFNSLDAQYDASQAYIRSQTHAGWTLLRAKYDDGGFSGGNTDRPALQRLLADVRAASIDVIVVYKVDRLTRSLADFAKLVELFDQHNVSFVSVTQQFNTTTSMGRLTLNVLLSFAQFEREDGPKSPMKKLRILSYADDLEFSTIRRKLARWAADNVRIIKDLKPPQPPGFNNRLSANWKLLLQIAQHAGGGWPEQACRSAIYLSRTPYEPSIGVQLLAALRAMFAKNRTQITSEQVVQQLLADPDSQWHEYRSRGPITKNQVAALLKDFEIRPVVVHPTKRADFSRHGYRAAQFEDAFARFLPHEPNIRTLKSGREGM